MNHAAGRADIAHLQMPLNAHAPRRIAWTIVTLEIGSQALAPVRQAVLSRRTRWWSIQCKLMRRRRLSQGYQSRDALGGCRL